MKHDNDVVRVLRDDGVVAVDIDSFENRSVSHRQDVEAFFCGRSGAVRVAKNERFGAVIIRQFPGEGNRLHFHPHADEMWVVTEGSWIWEIDGVGSSTVTVGDVIVVRKGIKHRIECAAGGPATRVAITEVDVEHVYA